MAGAFLFTTEQDPGTAVPGSCFSRVSLRFEAETGDFVFLYKPACLHMRVHDGASYKLKPTFTQILREDIACGIGGVVIAYTAGGIDYAFAFNKFPNVFVEAAELLLYF